MKNNYDVRVKDIMNLAPLKNAKIVTKSELAFENIIKRVNVLEVPDIHDWHIENELLLTQGFSLKEEKERQQLLLDIIDKGASALIIKSKRYLDKIPKDMIELANEKNFPLIELPFELRFSEIITEVMNLINSRQTMLLEYNIKIHKELMEVVLKGGAISKVCEEITGFINNTVIIEDRHEKLLSHCTVCKTAEEQRILEEAIKAAYCKSTDNKLLNINHAINNKYKEIKIPINNGLEILGYLTILETIREFSGLDMNILESATKVTAFAIINERTVKETEKKHLNEFINSLISGNIEEDDILFRGKHHNMDLSSKYNLVIIKYNDIATKESNFAKNRDNINKILDKIYNLSKFSLSLEGFQGIIGTKTDEIILIIEDNKFNDRITLKNHLNQFCQNILDKIKEAFKGNDFIISISNLYTGVDLSKAYKEARTAIMICKNNPFMQERIIHFDDLGVFKLLNYIPKQEQTIFLEEYLSSLLSSDIKNNKELIETLEAYFIFDGNTKDMAKYLHVHYNTVLYRLQKIKDIIGNNLESWDHRLNLQIALKILRLNPQKYNTTEYHLNS
ncbi:MAG: PucR family transcriptional regulator ligand-binding domain-containing protein [Clostridiaceae bacterium]|nr:PucR family transcriptional regulator ligand-binding domain-containing protein [Clostridiaceae bacterium]